MKIRAIGCYMNIITLATQRSGTKLLGNIFNCGGSAISYGEVFFPVSAKPWSFYNYMKDVARYSETPLEEFLDAYFAQFEDLSKINHFDLMYNQVSFLTDPWTNSHSRYIYNYFKSREFYVIQLNRSFKQTFCSEKLLEVTSTPHYRVGEENSQSSDIKFEVSTDEYVEYARRIRDFTNEAAAFFSGYSRFMRLEYEDIIPDEKGFILDATAVKLKVFLGMEEEIQFKPVSLLRSRYKPSECIKNYSNLDNVFL